MLYMDLGRNIDKLRDRRVQRQKTEKRIQDTQKIVNTLGLTTG